MSDQGLSEHPSPERGKVGSLALAFALWGGPLAWYAQLNLSYALAAVPCFPGPDRNLQLPGHAGWTQVGSFVIYVVLLLVALAAGLTALSLFRRTRQEDGGSSEDVEEAGAGRTRFLTYWAMLMGFGFSIVILANLAALIMVPPCAI